MFNREYRLYIIMRNDMDSMTGGRAAAQASHATSAFTIKAENLKGFSESNTVINSMVFSTKTPVMYGYDEWKKATTQHFGTTIVLGASNEELMEIANVFGENPKCAEFIHETIVDPTYPIKDGKTVHFVSVVTCMYVFCEVNSTHHEAFKHLPLF